ncbi:MAG: hypothetical protein M4D80_13865 [Myxococcota bacterium]|nr:hypothetical protein [Myxococcota bacterium]
MVLVGALGLVLAVVVVRELARWLVQRRPHPLRAMFDLVTPGSLGRRVATIAAGLGATYLAIVALGLGYAAGYGKPIGTGYLRVAELIEGGASVGKLRAGDRIEALDGEPIRIGHSLTDRINAKAGAPVDVHIRRDGEALVVRIEPRQAEVRGATQWLIGIRLASETERTTEGALGLALAFPWEHAKSVARGIAGAFEDRAEVASVVRIVEVMTVTNEPAGVRVLMAALIWSGHLLLLALLVDLIRLVLVIRDRLRA